MFFNGLVSCLRLCHSFRVMISSSIQFLEHEMLCWVHSNSTHSTCLHVLPVPSKTLCPLHELLWKNFMKCKLVGTGSWRAPEVLKAVRDNITPQTFSSCACMWFQFGMLWAYSLVSFPLKVIACQAMSRFWKEEEDQIFFWLLERSEIETVEFRSRHEASGKESTKVWRR